MDSLFLSPFFCQLSLEMHSARQWPSRWLSYRSTETPPPPQAGRLSKLTRSLENLRSASKCVSKVVNATS